MSPRTLKAVLFVALFVTLPVPFFFAEPGFAPPLRIAFLTLTIGVITAADGAVGVMPLFLLFLTIQTLVYSALAWGLAALAIRLTRPASPRAQRSLVGAMVIALFAFSSGEVYHTPHSSSGPYANLAGILD